MAEICQSQVQLKLWPWAAIIVQSSPWYNSLASLENSQLICLLPVSLITVLCHYYFCRIDTHQPLATIITISLLIKIIKYHYKY